MDLNETLPLCSPNLVAPVDTKIVGIRAAVYAVAVSKPN